jgi:hypothetical protein
MCNKIKQLFFYKADLLLFTKKNFSSKKGIKKTIKRTDGFDKYRLMFIFKVKILM